MDWKWNPPDTLHNQIHEPREIQHSESPESVVVRAKWRKDMVLSKVETYFYVKYMELHKLMEFQNLEQFVLHMKNWKELLLYMAAEWNSPKKSWLHKERNKAQKPEFQKTGTILLLYRMKLTSCVT